MRCVRGGVGGRGREESENLPEVRSGPVLQECVCCWPVAQQECTLRCPGEGVHLGNLEAEEGFGCILCHSLVVEPATWVIGPEGSRIQMPPHSSNVKSLKDSSLRVMPGCGLRNLL